MICNKMKKVFSIVLSILFMISMLPAVRVFADGPSGSCGENVTYSFNESTGELTISGNGEMENYESSGDTPWHDYCDSIDSVIIENGVTCIGSYAFSKCSKLTSVIIPYGVNKICEYAFFECTGLTSIVIPNSVESIDYRSFSRTGLTSIILPESVKSIGNDAFWDCEFLTSVTIGKDAFLGYDIFYDCKKMVHLYIPTNYNYMTSNQLGCSLMRCKVIVHYLIRGNCGNNVTYSFNKSIGELTISGNGEMENYQIDEAPWHVYRNNIKSVVIEDGVTYIGVGVFDKCSSLISINIPNSITTIGAYAFAECNLASIIIPESVTTIDRQAFNRCYNLTSATFLGNVAPNAGRNVFNKCSNLKKVIVPNEYTSSSFCGKSVQRLSESESNCTIA